MAHCPQNTGVSLCAHLATVLKIWAVSTIWTLQHGVHIFKTGTILLSFKDDGEMPYETIFLRRCVLKIWPVFLKCVFKIQQKFPTRCVQYFWKVYLFEVPMATDYRHLPPPMPGTAGMLGAFEGARG